MTLPRRIVGLGGGGFSRFGRSSRLDDYVLSLTQKDHPRVLFLGTAGGDADSHIVLFYEAFSGRARPAHLKLFGAPSRMEWRPLIRDQDVIYVGGGNTANMLAIWRVHGMDQALREAHYDGEERRRPVYRQLVSEGLPAGYAVEDSVGIVFQDTGFVEAVTEVEGRRAYRVEIVDGQVSETVVPTRSLVSPPAPASPAAPAPPQAKSPPVPR
ncbi:MAG: hypothetical protein AUI15_12585 [Actinobacteria bacterium 13_2_20CM_2_66_6]|nr:MAG: hypothetical protein AUI15_12585 [Actinobacteria bacterium 13_2_20CM_2_66_6]